MRIPAAWFVIFAAVSVCGQWTLINDRYGELTTTCPVKWSTPYLLELLEDPAMWEHSSVFNMVLPTGEPLYDLYIEIDNPLYYPSRVAVGYGLRKQQL